MDETDAEREREREERGRGGRHGDVVVDCLTGNFLYVLKISRHHMYGTP